MPGPLYCPMDTEDFHEFVPAPEDWLFVEGCDFLLGDSVGISGVVLGSMWRSIVSVYPFISDATGHMTLHSWPLIKPVVTAFFTAFFIIAWNPISPTSPVHSAKSLHKTSYSFVLPIVSCYKHSSRKTKTHHFHSTYSSSHLPLHETYAVVPSIPLNFQPLLPIISHIFFILFYVPTKRFILEPVTCHA